MIDVEKILGIAKRKLLLDKKDNWSRGSETFFDEIGKEIIEAREENRLGNHVKLEDELGDIFWDYVNILVNLEDEGKINLERVFLRAKRKYDERVSGLENNMSWAEIKKKQKEDIQKEISLGGIFK